MHDLFAIDIKMSSIVTSFLISLNRDGNGESVIETKRVHNTTKEQKKPKGHLLVFNTSRKSQLQLEPTQ